MPEPHCEGGLAHAYVHCAAGDVDVPLYVNEDLDEARGTCRSCGDRFRFSIELTRE